MTTKILNTLEGDYITVKGLRSGRLIEHEVYQEPAVAQWARERAAHDKSCEDLGIAKRGHAAANRRR
jgi:hypothetical protein